jgi:hypothetical protein
MKYRRDMVNLCLVIVAISLGLSSRYFAMYLPRWVNLYLGDILWAVMMFYIVSLILRTKTTLKVALVALGVCYINEVSQLYHSPWIDTLRRTKLGGLVLGRGFLWSDLMSYTIGIALGTIIQYVIFFRNNRPDC